jgi:hypothetical protein
MFLTLMVIGLSGLFVMAVPAFGGKHHGAFGRLGRGDAAQAALHAGQAAKLAGETAMVPSSGGHKSWLRLVPSPRLVFSMLALFGAFANAFVAAAGLAPLVAAAAAVVPAVLVERFAVMPIWRLMFRFQGEPSSPLEATILSDATAVTAFKNGRGIVSLVRDGRSVQFAASLIDEQRHLQVRVGDRLRVEDVDVRRERLTVSALSRH